MKARPRFLILTCVLVSLVFHGAIGAFLIGRRSQDVSPIEMTIAEEKPQAVLAQTRVRKSSSPQSHLVEAAPFQTTTEQSPDSVETTPILGSSLGIEVEYPRLSRELNEQGIVLIEVIKQGSQISAAVSQSSGYARLDRTALSAVEEKIGQRAFQLEKNSLRLSFIFKLK